MSPWRLKSPCGLPGCPALAVKDGRCERHQRPRQPRTRPYALQPFYDSAEWRRLRKEVLAEEPWCRCGAPTTTVHHIDGRVENMQRSNCEALCSRCHNRLTVTVGRGGWGGRQRRGKA